MLRSMLARARWSEADLDVTREAPEGCFQMKCFLLLTSLKPWLSQSFLTSDAFILTRHVNVLTVALGMAPEATLIGFCIVSGHGVGKPCQEGCREAC